MASGDMHTAGKRGSQQTGVMGVKKVKRDSKIWVVRGGIWIGALGLSIGVDLVGKSPVVGILPRFQEVHLISAHRFDS